MKKKLIFLCCVTFCVACKSPEDERLERAYAFEKKIDTLDMESFKIPDSVNTALIAASYYIPESRINTFLIFTNAGKTAIRKIDYLPDGKASVENLEILKRNEYRSVAAQMDYVIEDHSVSIIKVRQGDILVPHSLSYRRTDRD